jgi:hypothetical protein
MLKSLLFVINDSQRIGFRVVFIIINNGPIAKPAYSVKEISFGKHRHRGEENNDINLQETNREDVDWIHLSRGRVQWRVLLNTVLDVRVT